MFGFPILLHANLVPIELELPFIDDKHSYLVQFNYHRLNFDMDLQYCFLVVEVIKTMPRHTFEEVAEIVDDLTFMGDIDLSLLEFEVKHHLSFILMCNSTTADFDQPFELILAIVIVSYFQNSNYY